MTLVSSGNLVDCLYVLNHLSLPKLGQCLFSDLDYTPYDIAAMSPNFLDVMTRHADWKVLRTVKMSPSQYCRGVQMTWYLEHITSLWELSKREARFSFPFIKQASEVFQLLQRHPFSSISITSLFVTETRYHCQNVTPRFLMLPMLAQVESFYLKERDPYALRALSSDSTMILPRLRSLSMGDYFPCFCDNDELDDDCFGCTHDFISILKDRHAKGIPIPEVIFSNLGDISWINEELSPFANLVGTVFKIETLED